MQTRLTGLIPAAHTPFDTNSELKLEVVPLQAEILREQGVAGVFVGGTTGESASLTTLERMDLANAWSKVTGDDLPLIVHVGHNCQRDAIELAAHAQHIGAVAIAALAPSYFKPDTVDDLAAFLSPIAEAASATPFYFYDIPSLTNVRLPTDKLLSRLGERIGNLAGVKFTNPDAMMLQSCLAHSAGQYDILYGNDEALLAGLSLGCRGAVGSTYNYAAGVYHRVIEAFEAGDMDTARREQRKSVALVEAQMAFGTLAAGKAIMVMIGVDCGPTRQPLRYPTPQQREQLRSRIEHLDIFPRPLATT